MPPLIQPLFDGPIDIVGDVHGEIDALLALLRHLGYDEFGQHPKRRRLVFVGDLTDRGPDSPSVVCLVRSLVESGRAQCVLGNHDLNILLGHRKHDNSWFHGEEFYTHDGTLVPQVLADDAIRAIALDFFSTLPLALEREGLRVVHAYWDQQMVELARGSNSCVELYEQYQRIIENSHRARSDLDRIDRGLEHQNRNPVKLLTSGREERIDPPIEASGKVRHEGRVAWWERYTDEIYCVFGHYSVPSHFRSPEPSICLDFGVGKRSLERIGHMWLVNGVVAKPRLAALRFPEIQFVFDDQPPIATSRRRNKRVAGNWSIDAPVIAKVQAFFEKHRDSPFVQRRMRKNLVQRATSVTRDEFWNWMVACLLTSVQKSGPNSPVANFIRSKPFPLAYDTCRSRSDLRSFAEGVLRDFGGLRFPPKIGKFAFENMNYLEAGGWKPVFQQLEEVRTNSSPHTERAASKFLATHLCGLGPKQSRNVLQCLGLSKYEVPLDSRTSKWLAGFGFPPVSSKELQSPKNYELLSDNYQRLSKACGLVPCVLDAAIFSSFDEDGWTDEDPVW